MPSEEHRSESAREAVGNAFPALGETVRFLGIPRDDQESDDITSDDSDDESYHTGKPRSKKKSMPSSMKSLNGNDDGVVRQENDMVISLRDAQYKEMLEPELENFVQIRDEGERPNVKESAEAIMKLLRQIIQRTGGRYLLVKKNPARFVEIDEEGVMKRKFIRHLSSI